MSSSAKEPKFKVNDHVRVRDNEGATFHDTGYVTTVAKVKSPHGSVTWYSYEVYTKPWGRGGKKLGTYTDSELILVSDILDDGGEYVRVKKEFVKQAYEAACVDWKKKIKKEVPEVFGDKYDFGPKYTLELSTNLYLGSDDRPIIGIAVGLAPKNEQHQWLVVSNEYEPVIQKSTSGGNATLIGFKRKEK